MSSSIRSVASIQKDLVKVLPIHSPCYTDSVLGEDLLFPFVVSSSGILDIAYTNNFEADMVTSTGNDPTSGGDDPDKNVVLMGSTRLVTGLGDNFKEYIRAWRTATIDLDSDIVLTNKNCVATKVRSTSFNHSSVFQIDTIPPLSNYLNNNATTSNMYMTVWVFKTPLTFEITESGVKKYITFQTTFEDD